MDQTSSFKILFVKSGATLEVTHFNTGSNLIQTGQHTFVAQALNPTDLAEWQDVADELNNSTDPIISKFVYNPIFVDVDNDNIIDECSGILAVGKNYSTMYDFETADFTDPAGGLVDERIHYKAFNPTYNDIKIIDDHAEIELLTHVIFSVDKCKMPGKKAYSWIIKNNSKNVEDIYYNNKWLTYLFNSNGDYTIELEITDINGNTNKVTKNALTIK